MYGRVNRHGYLKIRMLDLLSPGISLNVAMPVSLILSALPLSIKVEARIRPLYARLIQQELILTTTILNMVIRCTVEVMIAQVSDLIVCLPVVKRQHVIIIFRNNGHNLILKQGIRP